MTHDEFTTRYHALGMELPDPQTICRGECEGTGWVPVYFPEGDHRVTEMTGSPTRATVTVTADDYARYHAAWREAEQKQPTDDGWHFLACLDCNGTGKRP